MLPPLSASTHNFPCQGRKEEHIIQFNNLYKLKSLLWNKGDLRGKQRKKKFPSRLLKDTGVQMTPLDDLASEYDNLINR